LLDINGLGSELKASMSLLFSRDHQSKQLARQLFIAKSKPLDDTREGTMRARKTKKKDLPLELQWDFIYPTSYLEHYHVFRPHLANVQTRMKEWQAKTLSELFTPAYFDRMGWITGVFGLAFGLFGALSLVASIVQIVLAVGAWKHPVPAPA
jgi:hypothetical protein